MELYSKSTLHAFTQLANDYETSDELNLEAFVKYKFPQDQASDCNYFDTNIEQIKTVIHSIEHAWEFHLSNKHANLFYLNNFIMFFPSCNNDLFSEIFLNQAGLEEKKDYDKISYTVTVPTGVTKLVRILVSYNGLKKLVDYMHSQLLKDPGNYNRCLVKLNEVLDFEMVYRNTKRAHANNRKSYLDELERIGNISNFYKKKDLDLTDQSTLYKFELLSDDEEYKYADDLNLEKFVRNVTKRDCNCSSECLCLSFGDEQNLYILKTIITAINSPDNLILDYSCTESFNLKINASLNFGEYELIEGKDYVKLTYEYNAESGNTEYVTSFNCLKKLEELNLCNVSEFENVYKNIKENHVNNRKAYLAELARVNEDDKTEEVKLEDTKPEVKTISVSHQKGMIIIRSTETEYIISKNIEDKLESVMEDLDEFSITHFEEFNSKPCNSTIIVIESIDKKSILKAMKLYK